MKTELPYEFQADVLTKLYFENISFPYYPILDLDLCFKVNVDGSFNIHYDVENNLTNISVRIFCKSEAVNFFDVELSKEVTEIEFSEDGSTLIDKEGYVYCSEKADIANLSSKITSMLICYNPIIESFDEKDFVPFNPSTYNFKGDGFYKIVATNQYGNKTNYVVVCSKDILGTVTETFSNKDSENYSLNYSDHYYSNSIISIVGYNMVEMVSEGAEYIKDGEKTTLIFTKKGIYNVHIKDINSHVLDLVIEIGTDPISYNESWLTGYNEQAILKNQGYTNKKLSINLNEEELANSNITQIYYKLGDTKKVIYGYDGEGNFIQCSNENFTECIGDKGDGIYHVYFSNKYGDVCIKDIYYATTPTLNITRTTNSTLSKEPIDLNYALSEGAWSNNKIEFTTSLHLGEYKFMVKNGEGGEYKEQNINYPFVINSGSASGTINYDISYLDAYGNYYEIEVNLYVRTLSFPTTNLKTLEIQRQIYSKNDFSFNYDPSDVTVVYSLNGSDYIYAYNPNEIIYKDGFYSFLMYDKADNRTILNIVKDSVAKFKVKTTTSEDAIIYGSAVNAPLLVLRGDNETVSIVSAKLNGVATKIEDFTFDKTGHYEILVEDEIGNISYFHFYLISHTLNAFEYSAPSDYQIYAAYFTNPLGIRIVATNVIDTENNRVDLTNAADGIYEIQMRNKYNNNVSNFQVQIDSQLPTVELVGCNDGDTTTKEISLNKLSKGDVVEIYVDGELLSVTEVDERTSAIKITEGGEYRIVITNQAGNAVEFSFNKLRIANTALSALIIIILALISLSFFLGLMLRDRLKNDK